jgi:LmbE family N-acetylglucosaminyl deacetylase
MDHRRNMPASAGREAWNILAFPSNGRKSLSLMAFEQLARGRTVIISPHLDDAVMSLGAAIATAVGLGASIEVLTVFGCNPASDTPATPWDAHSGFKTEGEAATGRREEDREACKRVGAEPQWLDFGNEEYPPQASEAEILSAVRSATRGADRALIPGYPLVHRDHVQLSRLLLREGLNGIPLGLYAEQPYVFYDRRTRRQPVIASAIESMLAGPPAWAYQRLSRPQRQLKARAIRAYQSQLRQLGLSRWGVLRLLHHEGSLGGEAIAWLS